MVDPCCLVTYSLLITTNVSGRPREDGLMMSEQEQTPAEEMLRWHDFGAWLTQRRLELGYTQVHVAGRAGISVQNLVSLEHGGFRRHVGGPWILPNPDRKSTRLNSSH